MMTLKSMMIFSKGQSVKLITYQSYWVLVQKGSHVFFKSYNYNIKQFCHLIDSPNGKRYRKIDINAYWSIKINLFIIYLLFVIKGIQIYID